MFHIQQSKQQVRQDVCLSERAALRFQGYYEVYLAPDPGFGAIWQDGYVTARTVTARTCWLAKACKILLLLPELSQNGTLHLVAQRERAYGGPNYR